MYLIILLYRVLFLFCILATEIRVQSIHRIEVVIARYNEDISHLNWLSEFPHVIYNRGEEEVPASAGKSLTIINQYENVGRESFIYLNHILHHFHHLANVTIFSQTCHDKKDPLNYDDNDFQETVRGFVNGTLSLNELNDGFAYLLPVCFNWQFAVSGWGFERDNYFKNLYNFEVPQPRFAPTGAFAITRELILRQPKSYYANIIRTLSTENSPRIGHFFERTWSELFHSRCCAERDYYCHTGNVPSNTCHNYG